MVRNKLRILILKVIFKKVDAVLKFSFIEYELWIINIIMTEI